MNWVSQKTAKANPAGEAGGKATEAEMGAQKGQARVQEQGNTKAAPEMKELVREASAALARLDAERLEELARCCQALNRDLRKRSRTQGQAEVGATLAVQAREAAGEFVVFTRVLEATRANLEVMMRLRAFQQEQLEYGGQARAHHWARPEASDGNN
jgi:hypothetical protein